MTAMPEAKLAREAEMCYALIGLPTDYDCWRPHDPSKNAEALLQEIIGNLQSATSNAVELLRRALPDVARKVDEPCSCQQSLQLAIWSDKTQVDPTIVERLEPLVGHYFAQDR
jgi:5'-methylthioadenosine phosphorylase